jgi:hypothetical protein
MVRCTGLALITKCYHPCNLLLVDLRTPLGHAPLVIPDSAPRNLAHM